MTYLIIAAALLAGGALVASVLYSEHKNREQERAETQRFRSMTGDERQEALLFAKRYRRDARIYRNEMARQYASFKWGHRHNPYRFRYTIAHAHYAHAQARVQKLEGIIAELDGNAA